jgi:restriction system protein
MAAIPDYQSVMLPLLKIAQDDQEHNFRESVELLGAELNLTEDELNEWFPNGKNKVFHNRVGWASLYLRRAVLLESTRRGYFKITDRGKAVLFESPGKIDNKYLEQFQDFIDFKTGGKQSSHGIDATKKEEIVDSEQTPEESLDYAYQAIRQSIASDLLDQVKGCSPSFFKTQPYVEAV